MFDKALNASRAALAALLLASAAGLAACGEHPTPQPAFDAAAPAPPRTEELAGGPDTAPPPAATTVEPSGSEPTPASSPESETPPPPPPPPVRADRDVIYDLGPVQGAAPGARLRHPRAHAHASGAAAVPVPRRAHAPRRPRPAPSTGSRAQARSALTPALRSAPAARTTATKAPAIPPRAATRAAAVAPRPAHAHRTSTRAAAAADRRARIEQLQSTLTAALAGHAALTGADRAQPDKPADVALTLPADFAQTVRREAAKLSLADAAASVNVNAQLSGEGYAVTPEEAQSQPLAVGQPVEFHWTVTPQAGVKGPLQARVGAVLLGGGSEPLSLGTVTRAAASGPHVSGRAIGAALLALIAVVVLAWLARGRQGGTRRRTRDFGPTLDQRAPPPNYDPSRTGDPDRR